MVAATFLTIIVVGSVAYGIITAVRMGFFVGLVLGIFVTLAAVAMSTRVGGGI